jgi:uncharacterized repeat protein (TIGR01451 family)
MKKHLLTIICIITLLFNESNAQVIRPFSVRYYNPSVRGNIVYVSNSIISTSGIGSGTPGTGEVPPSGTSKDNSGAAINIDTDGAGTAPATLIAYGSQWRFHDTVTTTVVGTGRLTNWNQTSYTDSWWRLGNAVIYYNDAGTTAAYNPGNATYPTTYFRKIVNIPSVSAYSDFTINIRRDDGAIIYINGVKVFADVFFASPTTYLTPAVPSTNIEGTNEYVTIRIPASKFVSGNNTIAVEVHNQTNTSTSNIRDMLFDFELLGNYLNTTFNSSTADLSLPTCSQILWAGLYWGADQGTYGTDSSWISADADKTVKLKIPGGSYQIINSQQSNQHSLAWSTSGFNHTGYLCFADITSLLNTSSANGTYTIANVVGPIGITNGCGGWTIVVAYANSSLQPRNLTVFDGSVVINLGDPAVDVSINGFLTPPSGTVSCELGAVVYDGDRSSSDSFAFKQSGAPAFYNLANTAVPLNGTGDAWNSKISYKGAVVTTRNPAFQNTLGYDAPIFDLPNTSNLQLGNNQTAATIRFSSPSENYFVHVLTTSISQYNPAFSFDKTATDVNGGSLVPGDVLRYQVNYNNVGNDSSTNTIILDNIPAGTTYSSGSIKINGVSKTDVAGDDQAEYDFTNNRVVFRLGVGANASTGGNVGSGQSGNVQFDVVTPSSCDVLSCLGSVQNSARINYNGKTSLAVLYDSTGVSTAGCITPGPVINTFTASCFTPKDTVLLNQCNTFTVLLPWAKYAGYTFYSAKPFITANIYNQYTPVSSPGIYWAYYSNGSGCSDTARFVVIITGCPDIDDDNDGIPDYVEFDNSLSLLDHNSNGTPNWNDVLYPGYVDNNFDNVNDNFDYGADSDNDGIPNFYDTGFSGFTDTNSDGVNDNADKDLDGIPNQYDLDSDNDGIPDTVESYGVDTNGDGVIDNYVDTDNDGFSQNVDANNTGVTGSATGLGAQDFDGDGIANYLDLDSDNDGIPDIIEVSGTDANNNGMLDTFTDANSDGISDNNVNGTALLITGSDLSPVDGRADDYPNKNIDRDFRPNAYDIDSDADGIVDVIESGLPDINLNGIIDGTISTNGWSTSVSSLGSISLTNTDGIGNPDYLDIDSDEDGIPDNVEGMSTAGYLLPATTDTDGDGLLNTYDNVSGFGGSGIFVYDHDADGTPDYRDLDTDGDGQADIIEGNDFNLNGFADDLVTLTGLDTDGDGLDNRFDSLNSVTNLEGTSYRMGNGGSLTGDATPGSRSPVQKKTFAQINRDWRFVGVVLPVQFLSFTSLLQNTQVLLNWTIIASKEVERFEVERSLDNATYINVGIVSDTVKLNEPQSFGYTDNISSISNDIIYYRLKVIGKAGDIKYSSILTVRKNKANTAITIIPNPVRDYVSVRFFVEKESEVTIRLVDDIGKTVMVQKQNAAKGNNMIHLIGLAKYGTGVYTMQVLVNNEIITQKMILTQ